ncbi:translation initiation factor IF-2 [Candidatus Bathyarchaeota archaeon]|nr:translation initiation factor IF-2 [Candidatus Bathyarchaeota archaeon]MBS7613349.1 translation initiation factor IF-2 [Candidatus Bathyarchaeota archaeon]
MDSGKQEKTIRQPIVVVLGHVDHGKTTLLDKIRGTAVTLKEPGEMTQHIGASFFPLDALEKSCVSLLAKAGWKIRVPGLLVIDTPGHSAFMNLRMRGGSVADIAVLVIDVIKGVEEQTVESIELLKSRRVPFLVAVNKIDLIPGWKPNYDKPFNETFTMQDPYVRKDLDARLYILIGELSKLGFQADRYDRIRDFTRTVALVPVSAKTGEGIPDLLLVLIGLTQQYLRARLETTGGAARGTVLEVKEEVGLGATVNVIIYDGILKVDDMIVLAGKEKPIVTKVRSLLLPRPLDEIRAPTGGFIKVDKVAAAIGVKIAAPNLEDAIPGSPLYVVPEGASVEEYVNKLSEEVGRLRIKTDKIGVVVKADTLGALEALITELNKRDIPVRLADIGDISKRDFTEAKVTAREKPEYGVILGFNIRILPDAAEESAGVPVFIGNIIYRVVEDYIAWFKAKQEEKTKMIIDTLTFPGKLKILPGYVFRRSKPAVVGVEVLAGRIKPREELIRENGENVGVILQVQDKGKSIAEAVKGMQVAISIDKAVIGRNVDEGDILYVDVLEQHYKMFKQTYTDILSVEEHTVLEEIAEIKRRRKALWGF